MSSLITEQLKKHLDSFSYSPKKEGYGIVSAVGDGVAEITGLEDVKMAEMLIFDAMHSESLEKNIQNKNKIYGVVLNLEEYVIKVALLGDAEEVCEGMFVFSTGKVLSIPVGDSFLGRVVNPLGDALDGLGIIESKENAPLERPAYPVLARHPVDTPLQTGIRSIDALVPIGRGQRELIIGDRFTGKTTIAIDAILNQKNEKEENRPICIYVAIGQKESKTARLVALLKEEGALEYTIIVDAPASSSASLQFLAPYSGVALAEYFMDKGKDVLIIYDDLSKQAVAYRELSLLLRRPPGREAYPGDIFYLHSRLLERSARLNDENGGGSITALPIIETQEGDVSAYIPTNVISITDGQIYLESDLFHKGIRPALNVGLSVSRVGSSAQTKAMKRVSGKLRLELAQFRELEAFSQFSSDLDKETKKKLEKGMRLTEVLKQKNNKPMHFALQVLVLHATQNGVFDGCKKERIPFFIEKFTEYILHSHREIYESIEKEKNITDDTSLSLKKVYDAFIERYNEELFVEIKEEE
jgi:F-type H+/Na+-transporting ATPase subunit alpha